ncbi:hypothetical protein Tco_0930430 [Tanacetum coccineum]
MPSPVDDKITPTASSGLSLDVNTSKSTPKKYGNASKTKPVDTDKMRQDVTKDSIESNGERIIEQSPVSTTPSVILEEDEALKDQSDHGIDIVSSDVNGVKGSGQSYEEEAEFGLDPAFSAMEKNLAEHYIYFFVNEFGVAEKPPLHSYLQLLLQLSTESSPSQASKTVFQNWSDGLDSGVLSSEEK